LNSPDGSVKDFRLNIEDPYARSEDKLFYKAAEFRAEEDRELGIKYSVVQIPAELVRLMLAVRSFSSEYTLRGNATVTRWGREKNARLLSFSHLVSVTPHTQALVTKQRKRTFLEKNAWMAALSSQELDEMRQESQTALRRAQVYRERAKRAETAGSALSASQTDLQRQDRAWEAQKVSSSPSFLLGMRFSRSPDYAACLSAFHKVSELARRYGIGDAALEAIDRIGILHASALYERWCLVKIISILIETYGFTPEAGWQDRVIHCVTGRRESLTLNFSRHDLDLVAKLEVQPELPNGRRPDFRLRFGWEPVPVGTGLVMDAKFRTRWGNGKLVSMLNELLLAKNYDQDGDRVFILQPTRRTVTYATSPLNWGRDCDFGHDPGTNHRKGMIHLAPDTGAESPVANLRRLIGLELQAAFPAPEFDGLSKTWISASFCIRCGKKHTTDDVEPLQTKKKHTYWSLTCASCKMKTTRTHCFGHKCGTVLFKNGILFTYHRTLADQITNVVCPNCGKHFDPDLRGEAGGA
jgi:hypothetical protein